MSDVKQNRYEKQVSLLIEVLPLVMSDPRLALKGGTAINLFVRDMPRLSVDIDFDLFIHRASRDNIFKSQFNFEGDGWKPRKNIQTYQSNTIEAF